MVSKAGCEIFLNNFLTGNSQINGQKSSRLGTTELKSGRGERTIFFLPSYRIRENHGIQTMAACPGSPYQLYFPRGQKLFQEKNGQLKNSALFLLRWSSLGWAGEEEGSLCPMKKLGFYLSPVSSAGFSTPQNSS